MSESIQHTHQAFNPDDPSLQKALEDPSVSNVILFRDPNNVDIVREYYFLNSGQKSSSDKNIYEPCDLHIDFISRRVTNSKETYILKAPPHRVSTLLSILLQKYPNPVQKYDMSDAIGKQVSKDSFRKAFSDLRKIVGEYVLPKESRALNPQSKIIIEKEIK